MEYPNKVTGTFIMSTGEAFNEEKLEILGTKGRILLENNRIHCWINDIDSKVYSKTVDGFSIEKIRTDYKVIEFQVPENPYIQMLQNFTNAIISGEALIAPGEEGEKSLILVNAAYLSAWKKEEIRLPFSEKEYEDYLKKMIVIEASI
jgi:predicted dehydrogenase